MLDGHNPKSNATTKSLVVIMHPMGLTRGWVKQPLVTALAAVVVVLVAVCTINTCTAVWFPVVLALGAVFRVVVAKRCKHGVSN